MSRFAIRTPYLIVVLCLLTAIIGVVSVQRMPVDMFPEMNIPVVAVATFFSGMPPEQIESDITYHFERMFTLASGIDHIESRSLPGVSLIKVYFRAGTNADADAASISTLAMADLKNLPPGTYPPIVLKTDPSSLPVCLVTLRGDGLNESTLKDLAQNFVRNQLASVPGSSVPQPFGGRWRQIMLYADPLKLEANQLSLMDVVRSVNDANIIMPAGDVQLGRFDYNIYTNALLGGPDEIAQVPLKMVGQSPVRAGDIGVARDSFALQYNIVRVNGQRAVYLPIFKQGGDSNTIAIVDGVRDKITKLFDVPDALKRNVVFDQSRFVKTAIETLLHEGGIGLFLTCIMILVFLGSMRATIAVFFSIPLSILATFIALQLGGSSLNSMVLGGLALALSRLIDNSVIVLENIFRHLERGEPVSVAAETGGREVALPVLAATLTTVVVFFPVTLLYGVSKFLFTAMALAIVISLFASYFVALTVVPLFCARFIHQVDAESVENDEGLTPEPESPPARKSMGRSFNAWFNRKFERLLSRYDAAVGLTLGWPRLTLALFACIFAISLLLFPRLGVAFFPRTDSGQFMINFKAPSGTKLDATEGEAARLEQLVRKTLLPGDLDTIVSNIGVDPGFSALFSPNSAMHTGFVQVNLKDGHQVGSYDYIERVKRRMQDELPELSAFFSSGSLVDGVLNMGAQAPIAVQVAGSDLNVSYGIAKNLAAQFRQIPGVADVYIPQDLDYPSLRLNIDRSRASELGLTEREVVSNVITALTSNQMIAPSVWIDPRSGNNYFLTVQYKEAQIKDLADIRAIPLHGVNLTRPTRLDMVSSLTRFNAPTEVDHYKIRRKLDVYIRPQGEDLGGIAKSVQEILAKTKLPHGVEMTMGGSVDAMNASFRSFATGLTLSVLLLYLILVAQFRSFFDPFIILLALPPGITGVLLALVLTNTTLNIMSLMGVVMLAGIAMSNSILIVEFAHHLVGEGADIRSAISRACRVRLRPILMTSLATIIGLLPMALKMGEGSEAYAPLARVLIGGLTVSVLLTVFLVPAGYFLVYGKRSTGSREVLAAQ
jgi:multidrug efflux pump subunit AcrB